MPVFLKSLVSCTKAWRKHVLVQMEKMLLENNNNNNNNNNDDNDDNDDNDNNDITGLRRRRQG